MPTLLDEAQVDTLTESVDAEVTEAEEAFERTRYVQSDAVGDLTYGGTAYGVRVRPAKDKRATQGRAVARRAWMWDGTESLLPLAWDPEGLNHDGGRRYLTKRHCLCCRHAGFRSLQCPQCIKNNCEFCKNSTEPGKVIRCFYLSKDKVPFPAKFYGSINCFFETCVRRDGRGFLSEQEMRLHARAVHRAQYNAHLETLAASNKDEVQILKDRLDALMSTLLARQPEAPAPLYVPDPKPDRRRKKR